jgi:hypothetical protein
MGMAFRGFMLVLQVIVRIHDYRVAQVERVVAGVGLIEGLWHEFVEKVRESIVAGEANTLLGTQEDFHQALGFGFTNNLEGSWTGRWGFHGLVLLCLGLLLFPREGAGHKGFEFGFVNGGKTRRWLTRFLGGDGLLQELADANALDAELGAEGLELRVGELFEFQTEGYY